MKPIEDISVFLRGLNGPATRSAILTKRKELRGRLKKAHASPAQRALEVQATENIAACGFASEEPIKAFLLTATSKNTLAALKKDYTDGDPTCIRIGQRVAADAALVVLTKMNALPFLYTKLPAWGFSRFASINLLSAPPGSDVTDAKVIATCRRGSVQLPALVGWPSEPDPIKLAENFVSEISGRKVHLFADEIRVGWESLVGDANLVDDLR